MANFEFKLTSEQIQSVTVFHVSGWLDAQSENNLVNAALEARKNGAQNLIVDMSEVDILTSAGIRALQKIHKGYHPSSEESGSQYFKLCNAPAQVYEVLSMTGFLKTVPMYESLQSALKSFE